MNALLKLKAEAERNRKFEWQSVAVTVEQFDPRTFIRWMWGLGWRVSPNGNGTGFAMPEHVRAETHLWRRSDHACLASINGGPDSDEKHEKVVKYFDKLFPEHRKAYNVDLEARRLIASNAKYLPVVQIGIFCFNRASLDDKSKGIPVYTGSEDDIRGDVRASGVVGDPAKAKEWCEKYLAELAEKKDAFAALLRSDDMEIGRKVAAAVMAYQKAERLWKRAAKLRAKANKGLDVMFTNLKPLRVGTGKPCAVYRRALRLARKQTARPEHRKAA